MAEELPMAGPPRSLRELMRPERTTPLGPIILPTETVEARNAFTIKPGTHNALPLFYGKENEDPYDHIRNFEQLVSTLATSTQWENACLKLFPPSLRDNADRWLRIQKAQSLSTWAAVKEVFYKKYFSESKTKYLTRQIQSYKQKEGESFLKCWERFKDLLLSLPHHGFLQHQLVSFFYIGLTVTTVQQIEYLCKEKEFFDQSPEEAWDFLDELAEKYRSWEPSDLGERSMAAQGPSGSGIFPMSIREHNVQAQLDKVSKQLEELKFKPVHQVNELSREEVCALCEFPGHSVSMCPAFPIIKEAYQSNQAEVSAVNQKWNPYSNTYNPGWAHNPLFSWQDQKAAVPHQAPPQQSGQPFRSSQGQMAQFRHPTQQQGFNPSSFGPPPGINHPPRDKQTDDLLKTLMQNQASFTEQTKLAIGDIRTQLTQLTAVVGQSQQEKGKFPSQPFNNTAGTHFVGDASGPSNMNGNREEAKAITTLRSGKVINKDLPPAITPETELGGIPEKERDVESEKERTSEKEAESPEVIVSAPVAPYPTRLVAKPKANVNFQLMELFKKIQFPISLMEAIDAIPQFAKILKDLCTSKRRTKSQNNVLLTEQVSSILQADIPIKRKDPGCPTIPIDIAGQKFEKALLDLGASVNLLPYSVYLRMGLGDLKATPVTLQLADRSVRIPKGVVEDVLVQVGEFLFPVDFIILDTCSSPEVFEETPIILGRPFLATSSAIMNCKTGRVQLSFGDLKMEVNMFHENNRVKDKEELHEVSLSDSITKEHINKILIEDLLATTEESSFLDSPEVRDMKEWLREDSTNDIKSNWGRQPRAAPPPRSTPGLPQSVGLNRILLDFG